MEGVEVRPPWRGRVFQIPMQEAYAKKHPKIQHSEYEAYLGDAATFLKRFQRYVPPVQSPIFIADGVQWIWPQWNWTGLKTNS